ncbi:Response regulator PleD [Pirellulimonas nuda]|uniref:diguanylate cyclase n=1 Tax=Pirellulimonas nuda TaxID=2528009 RepID=A0A518D9V2_9BACT|nr:diguanylate cyclase [Pirellulimonas nuda]QDU88267.1 Response regulator PleD [Pirellulimonas nuda]
MTPIVGISASVALAAVALIGYLVGRMQRARLQAAAPCDEVRRATQIVARLESIAASLRRDLALHRSRVDRFSAGVRDAETRSDPDAWRRIRDEAQQALEPTLQLAGQVSSAYEQIRQQSEALAALTGGRTDPATGLPNSRMLEVTLASLLAAREGGADGLTVLMVCIEAPQTADAAAGVRKFASQAARLVEKHLRSGDYAATYGSLEFVVVMPGASAAGAGKSATRLRDALTAGLGAQASCGIAESLPGDSPKSLLSRADSAAYSARAAGGAQFVHTGGAIRPAEPACSGGSNVLLPAAAPPIVDFATPGFVLSGR